MARPARTRSASAKAPAKAPAKTATRERTRTPKTDDVAEVVPEPDAPKKPMKVLKHSKAAGKFHFPALAKLQIDAEAQYGGQYIVTASRTARGDTYLETGILPIDLALMGGVPENRVTTLVGWEGSGKTTDALRLVASAQRKYDGMATAWIDAEHTLDLDWAQKHGVNLDQMVVSEPPQAEEAIDIIHGLMATGEVSLIVLDSLPALVPKATGESSGFDVQVADRARLIGKLCSKISQGIAHAKLKNRKLTVIFINQWRSVIGGYTKGPTKQMPGGYQPRYLASCILDLSKMEKTGASEDEAMSLVQKNTHMFKVVKSKIGNSLKQGEYDMIRDPSHPLGEGAIDDYLHTMTYAKRFGIWTGGGTKQYFIDECGIDRTFAQRDQAIRFFYDNPDLYNKVKREVIREWRERSSLPPIPNDGYLLGYK